MYKLYTATIEITRRCNAKCVHCIIGAGKAKPEELTTNEILTLIEDMSDKYCTNRRRTFFKERMAVIFAKDIKP